ncbi:MAG: hypothetical protein ABI310_04555, partial [Microbacteriaceae bacterium]
MVILLHIQLHIQMSLLYMNHAQIRIALCRARQIGIVAAFAIALIVMAGIVQAPLATAGQEPVRDGVI